MRGDNRIFVATTRFVCQGEGDRVTVVQKGETFKAGHPMIDFAPQYFAERRGDVDNDWPPPEADSTRTR
jgi:hypothetical protein